MEKITEEIRNCFKCGNLPKLTEAVMQTGKSRILIIGESPAKDGWIVSKKAFYNKDGKLQASGRVLDKLLSLCNLTVEDISFTEVCKCVISDRKTLKKCCENCRPILLKQLENVECDIILTMGRYPTETILRTKIKKLSDVVGKKFEINLGNSIKTVIPIYHPSPINPLGFRGNEKIFKELL